MSLFTFSKSLSLSLRERSSGIGESLLPWAASSGGRDAGSPPDKTGVSAAIAPAVAESEGGSLDARIFDIGDWGLVAMGGRANRDFFLGVVSVKTG